MKQKQFEKKPKAKAATPEELPEETPETIPKEPPKELVRLFIIAGHMRHRNEKMEFSKNVRRFIVAGMGGESMPSLFSEKWIPGYCQGAREPFRLYEVSDGGTTCFFREKVDKGPEKRPVRFEISSTANLSAAQIQGLKASAERSSEFTMDDFLATPPPPPDKVIS